MSWIYYVGSFFARLILWVFTCWTIRGKENVPKTGAFLLVANHIHFADPPVVSVSAGRHIIFMAKIELFHPFLKGYIIKRFGAFPVRRGQIDRNAIRQADELLKRGMGLAMFPEGGRSRDLTLHRAFPGSGFIAARADVPIVPVAVTGTENIRGIFWLFRRPEVKIVFGVPFRLPRYTSQTSRDQLSENSEEIMRRIAALLPEERRGIYADL